MTILDILRGRPRPAQVAQLVEDAKKALPDDPVSARDCLEKLGQRPWARATDGSTIVFGFALRAHASWLLGDALRAHADLTDVAASATLARSVLPILPLLIDLVGATDGPEIAALRERFGGCERLDCEHPSGVETALGVVRTAKPSPALVRWAGTVPATDLGALVRIAAFRRATEDPSLDGADSLLDGDSPRLLSARAFIAYRDGQLSDVMAMLPDGAELAGRAALGLTFREPAVPPSVRKAAEAYASTFPEAKALLAEHDGRWSEAAVVWRLAGRHAEARTAALVADPRSPFEPAEIHRSALWFAYAAGVGLRPEGEPRGSIESHNAEVGAARERIRELRAGSPPTATPARHPTIDQIEAILDRIAEHPLEAGSMLVSGDPSDAGPAHLAAMLVAPVARVVGESDAWRQWVADHAEVAALPRPIPPIAWLADSRSGAAPNLTKLDALGPEVRLPLMSALATAGAPWAIEASTRMLDKAHLATVGSAALPELAPLGFVLAARRDLEPAVRRRAATIAATALANRVARGTASETAALGAARLVERSANTLTS